MFWGGERIDNNLCFSRISQRSETRLRYVFPFTVKSRCLFRCMPCLWRGHNSYADVYNVWFFFVSKQALKLDTSGSVPLLPLLLKSSMLHVGIQLYIYIYIQICSRKWLHSKNVRQLRKSVYGHCIYNSQLPTL